MEPIFIFRESAFKHGVTEADIRHAFKACCFIDQYENRENVYLLLGFDMNANPVESIWGKWSKRVSCHALSKAIF